MRKFKVFSSFLVVVLFISFFSFNPGSGHFIQLGSEAWATPITSTVVNQAYDTSGNGGRKLVRLSNGWLVCFVADSSTSKLYFYKSIDNGSTWSQLCYSTSFSVGNGNGAICAKGTMVYFTAPSGNSNFCICYFDASTQANTSIAVNANIDTGQTLFGSGCSITYDSSGNLYAAWCSKNISYPNSFNIRHAKSTDGGVTWTKANGTAGVDQLEVTNISGQDFSNPSVVVMSNGYPCIVYAGSGSGNNNIRCKRYTGSSWNATQYILDGGSYAQSSPCAVVAPNGRILVVWHGYSASSGGRYALMCKYSDDNGATWTNGGSSNENLVISASEENHSGSICSDKNNNIYVVFVRASQLTGWYENLMLIKYSNGSWGSVITLTNQSSAHIHYPSTCVNYTDFTDPLCIYQDNQSGVIKFRGALGTPPVLTPQIPTQNAALFPNLQTPERR